ncbi:hypothetical protein ACQVAR_13390 [Edwardsiella tarda]
MEYCISSVTRCVLVKSIQTLTLTASFLAQGATPWVYNCSIPNTRPSYVLESGSATGTSSFSFWAGSANISSTLISDSQNTGNDYGLAILQSLMITGYYTYTVGGSITAWFYGNTVSLVNGGNSIYLQGVPGLGSPSTNNATYASISSCAGYASTCVVPVFKVSGSTTLSNFFYIAFTGSTFSSPVLSYGINLSPPKNEFQSHTIVYRIYYNSNVHGISGPVNSGIADGDKTIAYGYSIDVTCSRAATPLVLTLSSSSINFGTVMLGNSIPVNRPLTWTATGTGQASIWTLTFQPTSTDASGKYINLGGANVSLLDSGSNLVALNTPVNISGTSGTYTLSLNPATGVFGPQSTNLNVTLTAN